MSVITFIETDLSFLEIITKDNEDTKTLRLLFYISDVGEMYIIDKFVFLLFLSGFCVFFPLLLSQTIHTLKVYLFLIRLLEIYADQGIKSTSTILVQIYWLSPYKTPLQWVKKWLQIIIFLSVRLSKCDSYFLARMIALYRIESMLLIHLETPWGFEAHISVEMLLLLTNKSYCWVFMPEQCNTEKSVQILQ